MPSSPALYAYRTAWGGGFLQCQDGNTSIRYTLDDLSWSKVEMCTSKCDVFTNCTIPPVSLLAQKLSSNTHIYRATEVHLPLSHPPAPIPTANNTCRTLAPIVMLGRRCHGWSRGAERILALLHQKMLIRLQKKDDFRIFSKRGVSSSCRRSAKKVPCVFTTKTT